MQLFMWEQGIFVPLLFPFIEVESVSLNKLGEIDDLSRILTDAL